MTGNPLLDVLMLGLPVAAVLFWWTGARARELAVEHAKRACQRQQVQFLDQSVALNRITLGRSRRGGSCFRREYRFEFTHQGEHRDSGNVTMLGHELLAARFPYLRDSDGNRIYQH